VNVPTPFWAIFLLATAAVLLTIALFAVRDILRRRRLDRAIHDGLTGSYSSDFIREIYEAELRRASRTGVPFSVAFLAIHDRGGSVTEAQVTMARWLRRNVRSSDYVGRVDEQEFAIVFPETWEDDAAALLRRISTSMRYSPSSNGGEKTLTWDVGVATWAPDHPEPWDDARRRLRPTVDAVQAPASA
jgi:diguanylate cyclase (GGDEF)-like protein